MRIGTTFMSEAGPAYAAVVPGLINNAALDDTFVYAGAWSSISTAKEERTSGRKQTYTEYTIVINTDAGKKKIVERKYRRIMYDYLSVGDRVWYHQCSAHTKIR